MPSILALALAAGCAPDDSAAGDPTERPCLRCDDGEGGGDDSGGEGGGDDTAPTAGGVVTFTALAATTTELPWPLTSVTGSTNYLVTADVALEPGDRLYFYADYDMAGATLADQFTVFGFQLNADYCALAGNYDLGDDVLTGEVVDATGESPVTIPLSPLGGQGNMPDDVGVNVWDLSGIPLVDSRCVGTAAESVDYSARTVTYALFWQYEGYGATVRAFRLYVGRER